MTTRDRTRLLARPTTYNGITFRSRLESRWARAFDRAHWDWHYEPERFADPGSVKGEYVPDFRIDRHTVSTYVEIQPPLTGLQRVIAAKKLELVWNEHPEAGLWLLHKIADEDGGGFTMNVSVGWPDHAWQAGWSSFVVDGYLASLLAHTNRSGQ